MCAPPSSLSLILLLGGGCVVASPPPPGESSPTGEVRPAPALRTTADKLNHEQHALDRHPALSSPEDQPLLGCRELAIDQTVSWTCGPDRVNLVQHDRAMPLLDPPSGGFRGGDPTIEPVELKLGERIVRARSILNPRLDDTPVSYTLIASDEDTKRVASCVAEIATDEVEPQLRAWCQRAVVTALQAPPPGN